MSDKLDKLDMGEGSDRTQVVIYRQTYDLKGNEDPVYLKELGAIVDAKMREVADATGTADTLKVAILASLNIADDYLQARRGAPPREGRNDQRLAGMVTQLEEALAE